MKHQQRRLRARPSADRIFLYPTSVLESGLATLKDECFYWGFWTTPQKADMEFWSGAAWRKELAERDLLEARVFAAGLDFHWLEDRGVLLTADEQEGDREVIGGAGWAERDRKSRLWGEWLDGGTTWYEERIPRPLRYPGLEASAKNRFPFLEYREYIRAGVVEVVRYLRVKGEA